MHKSPTTMSRESDNSIPPGPTEATAGPPSPFETHAVLRPPIDDSPDTSLPRHEMASSGFWRSLTKMKPNKKRADRKFCSSCLCRMTLVTFVPSCGFNIAPTFSSSTRLPRENVYIRSELFPISTLPLFFATSSIRLYHWSLDL